MNSYARWSRSVTVRPTGMPSRSLNAATDLRARRVFVEGLNMVKRHQRPVPGRPNLQVGVIEKEGPIHISNVAIVDPKDHKPTRVSVTREGGTRKRVTRRSGTEID